MARSDQALEDRHRDVIAAQKLFFTATARADGRMTVMFRSLDAEPLILRLYGRGRVVRRQDAAWAEFRRHFPALPGERETLARWTEKKGPTGLLDSWREKNTLSIDGLPTGLLENP